jgi:hypothetical protein
MQHTHNFHGLLKNHYKSIIKVPILLFAFSSDFFLRDLERFYIKIIYEFITLLILKKV